MQVRTALPADIPVIRRIAMDTWPKTYGGFIDAAQIAYMLELMYSEPALQRQMDSGQVFLLAENEKGALGYAAYETGYREAETAKLQKLYVLPKAQGTGAGKAMLQAVAERAVTAGCNRLVLNVNRNNPARDFYMRCGFAVIKSEDIAIGNGYLMEDYVMEKSLE